MRSNTSALELFGRRFWLAYLLSSAVLHLLWELGHSPLYTLWHFGSFVQIASDITQCTLGDMAIAAAAILTGWWISRRPFRPFTAQFALVIATVLTGLLLTVAIEWASIHLLARWTYDVKMPVLPYVRVGVSPILQWLIVPIASLWLAFRSERSGSKPTLAANS